jgi:hypothetical protein
MMTKVVWIGVQYEISEFSEFATDWSSPNQGGHSSIEFPQVATINGMSIQANAKSANSLALFHLITWPKWGMVNTTLVGSFASHVVKDVQFKHPLIVPAGGRIYLLGEGLGSLEWWTDFYVQADGPFTFRKFEKGQWVNITQ